MTVQTIICLSIFVAIGLPMSIVGFNLINKHEKRVANWKKYPDSDEYMGALLQGWGGWMLFVNGGIILCIPIGYLLILLACAIFK